MAENRIKAVLGPTNTGKTHLAIERMCGHSSGMMGFPLRLLAREVYDRICRLKGERSVALITGEERIEPPEARYYCCTVEAMDRTGGGHAFVAIDEAQIAADPERGHIFTDRLLSARGREETMILGSATIESTIKSLIPSVGMIERPRFSTLSFTGACKLSRLPPRSAVVAFSADQVYAVAEALRRLKGGAAVVMGALSPETRNKQVELFQRGEVDYIVATDAIGMGLNLDLKHIAFAGLYKFDGKRKRRLHIFEMAQIAGRAGRHQTDGSFGTISGLRDADAVAPELNEEEIYALEEHQFAPLSHVFWRQPEPRFDDLRSLIADLEEKPEQTALRAAPETIDLTVLKKLSEEESNLGLNSAGLVGRLWDVCRLPDFRSVGPGVHASFIRRLWQDLREGQINTEFVAGRIAELDRPQGDISTLQARIAAIRSWAYICQKKDWVLAREEMFARAQQVEARLSDALHARLAERFINRRTSLLMKSLGQDSRELPVVLEADNTLTVDGEPIGVLEGFRFSVAPDATVSDRKMLLAAGEKALPGILSHRAQLLVSGGLSELKISEGALFWQEYKLADIVLSDDFSSAKIEFSKEIQVMPSLAQKDFRCALDEWLEDQLIPLEPLRKLSAGARDPNIPSEARALLHALIAGHGIIGRERANLQHLPKEMRPYLRKLGVVFGTLDVFAHALLKPGVRQLLNALAIDRRPFNQAMLPIIKDEGALPSGYRLAGSQCIRVDLAEKIFRKVFEARGLTQNQTNGSHARKNAARFYFDAALPISIGLEADNIPRLLGSAGFKRFATSNLGDGVAGPVQPDLWSWAPRGLLAVEQPNRKRATKPQKGQKKIARKKEHRPARAGGPFDALQGLLRR